MSDLIVGSGRFASSPTTAGLVSLSVPSSGLSGTSNDITRGLKDLARPSPTATGHIGRAGLTLEERLYDTLASFKVRTATVAMHLDRDWRTRLFSQLDGLLAAEDWEEDDLPPDLASFATFLRLITFLKPSRRPGLGATHDGHLIASWTAGADRLTLECLRQDAVRWALSRCLAGNARESAAGITPVARLADVLQPYEPAKWFTDGGKANG